MKPIVTGIMSNLDKPGHLIILDADESATHLQPNVIHHLWEVDQNTTTQTTETCENSFIVGNISKNFCNCSARETHETHKK
jgi:hypothetical protein